MNVCHPLRALLVAVVIVLLLGACPPVSAAPASTLGDALTLDDAAVVTRLSLDQLQSLLRSEGYTFLPHEKGIILWKIDGMPVNLQIKDSFIRCWIVFSDVSPTLEKMNEWNRTRYFSTACLNEEGKPCMEVDLDLEGGITVARLKNHLKNCRTTIVRWYRFLVE